MYRIQWLLVNRLVLNLSHGIRTQGNSTSVSRTKLPEISFHITPVLGTIGAPLRSGYDLETLEDIDSNDESFINDVSGGR